MDTVLLAVVGFAAFGGWVVVAAPAKTSMVEAAHVAEAEHAAALAEEKVLERQTNEVLDRLRPAGAAAVHWTFEARDPERSASAALDLMLRYASASIDEAEREEDEDRWEGEGGSLLRYTDE